MGDILVGRCSCGFEARDLFVGPGMTTETYCGTPAVCSRCGRLDVYNILSKRPRCRTCRRAIRFYIAVMPPDYQSDMDTDIFGWHLAERTLVLRAAGHVCPKCGHDTLQFQSIGCWD